MMSPDKVRDALSSALGRPAYIEACVLRNAYRIVVPVKVRGMRRGHVAMTLSADAVDDSIVDLAAMVRHRVEQAVERTTRKVRRSRMRRERAARKRRRGWA